MRQPPPSFPKINNEEHQMFVFNADLEGKGNGQGLISSVSIFMSLIVVLLS